MKKKKNYTPRYACDIKIDEKGRGTFNALSVLWQLRTIIGRIIAPSQEEISKLASSAKVTWDEAQAELLKKRQKDISKYSKHAEKLLRAEIGPFIDDELWKLVGDIAKRTISELTPEISIHVEGNLQRRTKEVIKDHQAQKRWLLGLSNPGAPSQWNKSTLTKAVEQAADHIPKGQLPTLSKITAKINSLYKLEKVLTTEGLRKLLDRNKIEWKELRDKLKKRT